MDTNTKSFLLALSNQDAQAIAEHIQLDDGYDAIDHILSTQEGRHIMDNALNDPRCFSELAKPYAHANSTFPTLLHYMTSHIRWLVESKILKNPEVLLTPISNAPTLASMFCASKLTTLCIEFNPTLRLHEFLGDVAQGTIELNNPVWLYRPDQDHMVNWYETYLESIKPNLTSTPDEVAQYVKDVTACSIITASLNAELEHDRFLEPVIAYLGYNNQVELTVDKRLNDLIIHVPEVAKFLSLLYMQNFSAVIDDVQEVEFKGY